MTEINHDIEENLAQVNTITLLRIYDVLSVLLAAIDPAGFDAVMMTHASGQFVTPEISVAAEPYVSQE